MLGTDLITRSTPPTGRPAVASIDFRCPVCKGPIHSTDGAYNCEPCGKVYPILLGIPDFRIYPDPYIDMEADRLKAQVVAERYEETDYRELIAFYWSITPDVPPDLVDRYVRHALAAVERGRHLLDSGAVGGLGPAPGECRRCLELGCGTGGLLVTAGERFDQVVGIDIAFRWLVIAKKRLEEMGVHVPLVCCCAEYLPFSPGQFDLVVCNNVIEHSTLQENLLREAFGVLRPGGMLLGTTVNRFSLAPEPHVRVLGVGWLPRRWMDPFVRWARGFPYRHIRLLSYFELRRLMRRASFSRCRIELPSFSEAEQAGLPARERRLVAIYHKLRAWPIVRQLLMVFGPSFLFVATHEGGPSTRPGVSGPGR